MAPPLRRVNRAALASVFASGGGKVFAEDVLALFLPRTNRVLIADDLGLNDAYDLSFVVHELVHAQQFSTRRAARVSCPGKLEFEAYSVQARFLRAHGLEREALLKDILGQLIGGCDRPVP